MIPLFEKYLAAVFTRALFPGRAGPPGFPFCPLDSAHIGVIVKKRFLEVVLPAV